MSGRRRAAVSPAQHVARWPVFAAAMLLPAAFLPHTYDPFSLPKQLLLVALAAAVALLLALFGAALPRSRVAMALGVGFAAAELLAFAGSVDRLGSFAGVFGYRLGLLTHLSLALLFVGAAVGVRTPDALVRLCWWGLAGSAAVACYALLQFAGGDPFSWGGPDAVFSTLGNPNDLAGYLVLSVAFAGAAWTLPGWRRFAALAALLVVDAALVVATESRSGLIAMAAALVALPLLLAACGLPRVAVWRLAAASVAVGVVAAFFGALSGEAGVLESRFSRLLSQSAGETASAGTRLDLWRGTLAVIASHPLVGAGQDGLEVQFNRERPADLGPPFSQHASTGYDPLVASPHSLPLEVAVTLGVPAAILAVTGAAWWLRRYWRLLRSRRSPQAAFLGAGLAGYLAMALFNPLPLASLAIVAILGGSVVGLTSTGQPVRARPGWQRATALAAGVGACVGALLLAGLYLAADSAAYEAVQAASRGDDAVAATKSRRAAALVPFEAAYRRQEIDALVNLSNGNKERAVLERARAKQVLFLEDFAGLAPDFLSLARLRVALGEPGVDVALAAARRASPYGVDTADEIARVEGLLAAGR